MKSNTKSSVTLPADELKLVNSLKKKLGAKSKVEVIRQGLRLLSERTDREALRRAYAQAAEQVRPSTLEEVRELDGLAGEGLVDEA
jgi:Arc/MetJ-type ribon-helix-helix transcriptional regulator